MVAKGLTDSWVQGDWLVEVVLVTAAGINPSVQPVEVVLVTAAGISPSVQPTCVCAGLRCWARGWVAGDHARSMRDCGRLQEVARNAGATS